jgi:hypothetical protein
LPIIENKAVTGWKLNEKLDKSKNEELENYLSNKKINQNFPEKNFILSLARKNQKKKTNLRSKFIKNGLNLNIKTEHFSSRPVVETEETNTTNRFDYEDVILKK